MVVLIQTHREEESVVKEGDFSLDDLPLGLKIARPRKLEEEARKIFEEAYIQHICKLESNIILMHIY